MPTENSFDPDICGSKRPTYPEKDNRFEELFVRLLPALSEENKINYLYEMRNIYRALKQENKELRILSQPKPLTEEDRKRILSSLIEEDD